MRWLNGNVRRWEAISCTGFILLAVFLHTRFSIRTEVRSEVKQAVRDEVGRNIQDLKTSVEELKGLLKEFKEINIIQNQQVIVPDREAELRHQRIRERYVQKVGETE